MTLKEKQIRKTSSIKNPPFFYSSMLVYGQSWILFILVPFFYLILYGIFRDYYKLNVLWVYLVIAMGSLLATLRIAIKPPNPFGESWLCSRTTAMLTEEERKVLTFLKTSKTIKKIAIITGSILFLSILVFPLIKLLTHYNTYNYITKKVNLFVLFGVAFIYGFSSYLFLIFIISRYIINHWKEIQQSDIEPWPKDKSYSTGPFRYHVQNDGYLIGDILAIDPNMPFNWYDFLIILAIFLSICLIFWGVGAMAILFSKMAIAIFILKTASFITGIVILNIGAKMWYKKHKKK
ncbi:MAG: hypothetical protein NTX01_05815 [Candidatus Omnitrophica bacterium]|nr:hypothetical protein [Candidatus Omnitrophota bacterium]